MQRMIATALVASALGASPASAQLMQLPPDAYRGGGNLGGGFIELLFGNGAPVPARPAAYPAQPQYAVAAPHGG
jgi:hypothetical protein